MLSELANVRDMKAILQYQSLEPASEDHRRTDRLSEWRHCGETSIGPVRSIVKQLVAAMKDELVFQASHGQVACLRRSP